MKIIFNKHFFDLVILLAFHVFLFGCINHQTKISTPSEVVKLDSVKVEYAKGFEINYRENEIYLQTKSVGNNEHFSDTFKLKTSFDSIKNQFVYENIPNYFVCQSSTHLAYFDVLNTLEKVKGVCGLAYLNDKNILDKLVHVQEICTDEKTNYEVLKSINPDVFLIYPFDTEGKNIYNKDNIKTLFIAEYLETNALARLEWIKLFGLLTNKVHEANTYFNETVATYNQIKNSNSINKKFILNLPYKDAWYMPSSNSLIVNLFEDAGISYFYENDASTENVLRPTEQIWSDGITADYWIIMAGRNENYSLRDLISEEPIYAEFKSVKEKNVIFCNTTTSNYFVQGVVEPHVMLKDILFATKQIQNHVPVYFKRLE